MSRFCHLVLKISGTSESLSLALSKEQHLLDFQEHKYQFFTEGSLKVGRVCGGVLKIESVCWWSATGVN